MSLFRKGDEPHHLSIAMTAVRPGDRLLQIGCADPSLLGAISSKVGLTGRACVVARDEATAARARRGAENAGVLVEVEQSALDRFPFDDGTFDLVVVDSTDGWLGSIAQTDRLACLREGRRLLDHRGRLVAIEAGRPTGLASLFRRGRVNPEYVAAGGTPAALEQVGFGAIRTLAERDGLVFVEGGI